MEATGKCFVELTPAAPFLVQNAGRVGMRGTPLPRVVLEVCPATLTPGRTAHVCVGGYGLEVLISVARRDMRAVVALLH